MTYYRPPEKLTHRQNIPLIPAEAGTQVLATAPARRLPRDPQRNRSGLGPRFRGDERNESEIILALPGVEARTRYGAPGMFPEISA